MSSAATITFHLLLSTTTTKTCVNKLFFRENDEMMLSTVQKSLYLLFAMTMSFLYEYIIKHLFYAKLKEVGHKHRTNHCCECCFVDVGVVLHCFDCRFDDLFYLELFAKVDFTKNFVECHFDVNSRLFLKCCTRFMK